MSTLTKTTTTTTTDAQHWSRSARVGAAGIAAFFATSVVIAAVTPGYRTARDGISALAATDSRYGLVMIGGFLLSIHFWVHQYVSLAMFLTLVAAMFVLVRATRRTEGFGHLTVPTRIVAYTTLVTTVAAVTIGFGDVSGLVQRPFLALLFGWPVLLAGLAARSAR
jgi:hypothetical protein